MTGAPSPNAARTVLAIAVLAVLATGAVAGVTDSAGAGEASSVDGSPSVDAASAATAAASLQANVSEPAAEEPAPEPGDEFYEATASDGSWISYKNPRDDYRNPYLGDGSGKICVTLLNEAGEPVVGESVPNTTVSIPTGDQLEWHSYADPMTVEYPLTDNYEFPLDGDQFGTSPDVPQGDGYMDSHCIEMHGHPEDATIEYGEVRIEGDHADDIELVGYIQQQPEGNGWDSSVDPVDDAVSYEEVGGSWTYRTDASHGQVVAVLQLDVADGEVAVDDDSDGTDENETDTGDENESDDRTEPTADDPESTDESNVAANDADDDAADTAEETPGFGPLAAVAALSALAFARIRR